MNLNGKNMESRITRYLKNLTIPKAMAMVVGTVTLLSIPMYYIEARNMKTQIETNKVNAPIYAQEYMDKYDSNKDGRLDESELTSLVYDLHPWERWPSTNIPLKPQTSARN